MQQRNTLPKLIKILICIGKSFIYLFIFAKWASVIFKKRAPTEELVEIGL